MEVDFEFYVISFSHLPLQLEAFQKASQQIVDNTQYRYTVDDKEAPFFTNCVTAIRYIFLQATGSFLPKVYIGDMPRTLIACGARMIKKNGKMLPLSLLNAKRVIDCTEQILPYIDPRSRLRALYPHGELPMSLIKSPISSWRISHVFIDILLSPKEEDS